MQNSNESLNAASHGGASISNSVAELEKAEAHGIYHVHAIGPVEHLRARYCELRDMLTAGVEDMKSAFTEFMSIPLEPKWEDTAVNVVTTVGKNYALDGYLQTAVTIVGPYMGLINTNASSAVVGDTMASHAGWLEVGNANAPTYTAPRKTAAWSAASGGSKALSSALSFAIGSSGTVGGCFLVLGTGAVSTIDNTSGVLYSAGAFTGGSKTVSNGDTLNVSYTASL